MTTCSKRLYALTLIAFLIAITLPSLSHNVQAQTVTTFTPQDTFEIPAYNGTIRFALNGTYTEAYLKNDTWTFKELTMNNSAPLGTLEFSAENCDVTINGYFAGQLYLRRLGFINYKVEGAGEQKVNLGLNTSRPTNPSEWTVITQDDRFLAESENWQLLPDDTLRVYGITGNLSILHYDYGYTVDDRPFYLQHSVIITTAIAVAITVTIGTVIKLKNKARQP